MSDEFVIVTKLTMCLIAVSSEVHWLHCEELQLLVERIVSDAFAMVTMLIRL